MKRLLQIGIVAAGLLAAGATRAEQVIPITDEERQIISAYYDRHSRPQFLDLSYGVNHAFDTQNESNQHFVARRTGKLAGPRLTVGTVLSRELNPRFLPYPLQAQLPARPATQTFYEVGNQIVLIDRRSRQIISVLPLAR